jgi:N-methylhydantoinase A/oxoprolinase/acetone carboxylase beta subunit
MRYLDGLTARLAAAGQPAPSVMTSGGGMQPAARAARHAASLALSGPAGGIVGAAAVLAAMRTSGIGAASLPGALTMDIGGTSADAGLILGGEPLVESGGDVAGVPIALPRVLVETVSAGGGSIAWIDDGGALRVGPRSAGARPGPVAFGRGGTEPTVTDAQVVLGRIVAREMSGGVSLDVDGARAAIATLAKRLGSDVERTARAILAIADAEMARALRRVSVERGVDPRQCALVAFGGGGPLHACALADALAMPSIIVPPFAGVLSAVGLALAPERRESAMSLLTPTSALTRARLDAAIDSLVEGRDHRQSKTTEHREPQPPDSQRTFARMRYRGQGHELEIAVQPGDDSAALAARFAESHATRYGFTLPAEAEVVALRHEAGEPARAVRFERDDDPAPVTGPATVQLPDATLFVAEGWHATPLPIGGWLLERR